MERDCESELSKLNIEQNACIYHFGASVIHGQRSNILRLPLFICPPSQENENLLLFHYFLEKHRFSEMIIRIVDGHESACDKKYML